jgi:hypothetical protein
MRTHTIGTNKKSTLNLVRALVNTASLTQKVQHVEDHNMSIIPYPLESRIHWFCSSYNTNMKP